MDVQDAPAGEAMEVVVDGKGRLVEQAALRSFEAEELTHPLQGLQGGVHGVQRYHGMGLADHLVDLSRAGMPKLAHGPVDGGALGGQPEPMGAERLGQLPPGRCPGGGLPCGLFRFHFFLNDNFS
jgi:hypothetical protein